MAAPKQKYNKPSDISEEFLREVVAEVTNYRAVCRALNISTGGRYYEVIIKMITDYNIDTSHFRSKLYRDDDANRRLPLDELLTNNSKFKPRPPHLIKERLISEGLAKNECEICGQGPQWRGKALPLKLGYRNGDNLDTRRENLRILCPNCWQQVEDRTISYRRGRAKTAETLKRKGEEKIVKSRNGAEK